MPSITPDDRLRLKLSRDNAERSGSSGGGTSAAAASTADDENDDADANDDAEALKGDEDKKKPVSISQKKEQMVEMVDATDRPISSSHAAFATAAEKMESFGASDRPPKTHTNIKDKAKTPYNGSNVTATSSATTTIQPGAFAIAGPDADTGAEQRPAHATYDNKADITDYESSLHHVTATLVQEEDKESVVIAEATKSGALWIDVRDKRVRLCVLLSVILIVIAVVLGVVLGGNKELTPILLQTEAPSAAPSSQPTVFPEHCDDRGRCWSRIAHQSGLAIGDSFGGVVSMGKDGTRIAVAAKLLNNSAGAVFVYDLGDDGSLIANTAFYGKLESEMKGILSRDGNHIILAAQRSKGENGNRYDIGEVQVFRNTGTDNGNSQTWEMVGTPFFGDDVGARAGRGFDISNDGTMIVYSAIKAVLDGDVRGYVQIWQLQGDKWIGMGNPNLIVGEPREDFGWHLSLSNDGTRLLVGARAARDNLGSMHMYECRSCTSNGTANNGTWIAMGKTDTIEQNGGIIGVIHGDQNEAKFGGNTATNVDGTVIVGGKIRGGFARTFSYNASNDSWSETGEVEGKAVALSSDGFRLAVGPHLKKEYGWAKVYDYDFVDNQWKQVGGTIESGRAGDNFGAYVAFSSDANLLVVGSPAEKLDLNVPGTVSVYRLS